VRTPNLTFLYGENLYPPFLKGPWKKNDKFRITAVAGRS
jgi:hypothetical protein